MSSNPLGLLGGLAGMAEPLSEALLRTYLFKLQQDERQKAASTEQQQRERAQMLQDYHLLVDVATRYQQAGQQVPQAILARLNDVQTQLMGAGLPMTTAPSSGPGGPQIGGTAGRLFAGAGMAPRTGVGMAAPQPGQFEFPGPKPPAFQTVGEMAAQLGYKVRPGVNPNLRLDTLPPNVNPSALFVDPGQEAAQARARVEQLLKTYPQEQIFSTPELREAFLRDWETATGQPFPTRQTQQTVPVTIGQQRPGEGSLGQFLRPQGQQTVQVPTGQMSAQPIMPQAVPEPPRRVALLNKRTGKIQIVELPAGTDIQDVTPPNDPAAPTQHAIVDRNGNVIKLLPPGVIPHNQPQLPRGGGSGGAGAGLTPSQQRVLSNYNRLVDQRMEILKTLNAGTADSATKQRLDAELKRLDRQIQQLEPHVNRLLFGGAGTPPLGDGATGLTPDIIKGIQADARDKIPWGETEAALREMGITDPKTLQQAQAAYQKAVPARAPSMRVSSDVANQIRSLASALKRQRVDPKTARIRIFDELRKRGVNIGDANVAAAVDVVMGQVFGVRR